MPRRGSRPQLVYLLADFDAWCEREVLGNHHAGPGDFYNRYSDYSLAELKELARTLSPRKPGRPKSPYSRSRYENLRREVDELRSRRKAISERRACQIVAARADASAAMLRKHCRSRRRTVPI